MIQTYRRLQRQRAAGEIDGGFTLIELLIVIVVLGILAAIVVFALGGVTGKSVAAACQSDAKTLGVGVAALEAENPTLTALSTSTWKTDMLATTTVVGLVGNPFVQTWPNSTAYSMSISDGTSVQLAAIGAGPTYTVTAPAAATPPYGDVLVTGLGASGDQSYTYDATQNPIEACNWATLGKA